MSAMKKMHPEIIVWTAVLPKSQDSARWANESTPVGVHKELRQQAESNIKNLEPSARKATKTAGRSNPGQNKETGKGLNRKSHEVI